MSELSERQKKIQRAVVLVLFAMLLFAFNMAPVYSFSPESANEVFLTSLNGLREKNELPVLEIDEDLTALAQIRAEEVITKFSHIRPDGSRGCDLVLAEDPDAMCAGENLVSGKRMTGTYAAKAFQRLCGSSSHLKNMLNPDFTKIGVATCVADDGHVVTVFLFQG